MRRYLSIALALTLTVFLAACDSAEDRAEEHFNSAKTLLAEGDTDRAIVELRNVFQLVPNHLEARYLLADTLLNEKQDLPGAYGQYLRLSEQYPDDLRARVEMAEIAFFAANWDEMIRHGTKARELAPDDTRVQIIGAAIDYRQAAVAGDEAGGVRIVNDARSLIDPENPSRLLRELVLDDLIRGQEFTESLAILDGLTADYPTDERLWRQRLQMLIAIGDQDAIEAQLVDLVDRFPDNSEQKQTLIRYYLARGELDKTEDFLRSLVAQSAEDDTRARVDLVRFLVELRTVEEARAEITDAIATEPDTTAFIMMGAALDFEVGQRDSAINDLETAIENAGPESDTNSLRVTLARMLLANGNDVGARALVETVLLDEPGNVQALKMSAQWLIDADDVDGAIAALRTALDTDPEDSAAMTLMAAAYSRIGSADLARDFLALAAEESGNAPEETLRYVQLLISEERYLPAEDVLLPALRIAPTNLDLLRAAGQLYLEMDDLGRTQQVIDTLRRIETPDAIQTADQLELARLNRTEGADEAIRFLEGLAEGQDADVSSKILLLRARISTGDMEGAIAIAQDLVAESPDAPGPKQVLATTLSAAGDLDGALAIYRGLEEQFPLEPSVKISIAELQTRMGDPEAARATVLAALQETPDDARLLWANASYLETDGNIDEAIAIYEQMYEMDSGNIIVANNLASLIGTYRDDPDSLDRAWTIARRFRDTDLGAIQDTYGWLTHRRGDSADALPYLQSASEDLADDPIVQFHLAEVLFALEQNQEALEQYRATLDLAGIGDTRPMIETSRSRVAEIEAILAAQDAQTE